jgi:CheY-like chemotaxis protein
VGGNKLKILVVDDETSFGSLLGRALKRLGHTPEIAAHPVDALEMFREQPDEFDAVITDIDMPVMSGVELASSIRAEVSDMPIAFCTGSSRDEEVVDRAKAIGAVLPKVWTVADVKRVLSTLQIKNRLARGSQTSMANVPQTAPLRAVPRPRAATSPMRKVVRKIKVTCRTWGQVDRLCDEQSSGRQFLTLRGDHKLKVGERLTVALSLPDELVLSIAAEVASVRRQPASNNSVFSIHLVGLTPEVCARLRSMVLSASEPPKRLSNYHRSSPRAVTPQNLTNDDITPAGAVLGNLKLRKQIDDMPGKMTGKNTKDSLES